jgi:hypothetical protein
MREMIQKRISLLLLLMGLGMGIVSAQWKTREPYPLYGVTEVKGTPRPVATKTTATTTDIACAGTVLLDVDFESGIPAGWLVIDGDGRTPASQTGLQPGWQSRMDYRDSTNTVMVSPSWYAPVGQSDDWLISPAVTLGSNPCLSWRAYSQDENFKETYEVRVATTPDTAAFKANAAVETVVDASGDPHAASASLAGWANQTVYIAFRQTSVDKFVLALDDVKVSNVNQRDVGVYSLQYGDPDPGDTVTIRFEVANYGSDTITSFQAMYSIDGGAAQFMSVGPVSIPPNATVFFNHDSLYLSDTLDANYSLCAWTNLPNAAFDQEMGNDTLCGTLTVGSPVGRPEPRSNPSSITLYPNPTAGSVSLLVKGLHQSQPARLRILDAQGRTCNTRALRLIPNTPLTLDTESLAPGVYFIRIDVEGQAPFVEKLMKR